MDFCTLEVLILLSGFTDLDWAGSVDDKKSTSGYLFSLGSGAVTWTSKKQQAVSLSSTEAKYRGTVKARCEVVWLRPMLGDMQMSPAGPTTPFVDNEGIIELAPNPVFHEQTKHVDVHCHYIRQLVKDVDYRFAVCSYHSLDCRHSHQASWS